MVEVETDIKKMNLRSIAPGFIGFNVKARDTEANQATHDSFREFCKVETDRNYTQGLNKLLDYYAGDYKYEMIYSTIQEVKVLIEDLRSSVISLQSKPKEDEEDSSSF